MVVVGDIAEMRRRRKIKKKIAEWKAAEGQRTSLVPGPSTYIPTLESETAASAYNVLVMRLFFSFFAEFFYFLSFFFYSVDRFLLMVF